MLDEVRVSDMIESIKGIAETLELNNALPAVYQSSDELLASIKAVYLSKIDKAINSAKYDKAETASAAQMAEKTKKMLADKSAKIASLFGV